MIKVFGTSTCSGCIQLRALLDSKEVEYEYYDIREPDGLAEMAIIGLADELSVPVVANEDGKIELNTFTELLNNM